MLCWLLYQPLIKKERKIQPCWLGFVPIHVTNSTAEYQREEETQTLYDADTNANTNYDAPTVLQHVDQFSETTLKHVFKDDTKNVLWLRIQVS